MSYHHSLTQIFIGCSRRPREFLAVQLVGKLQLLLKHLLQLTALVRMSQLFKQQGDYFDIPSSTLTPLQIREKLAALAAQVIPASKVEEFNDLLRLKSSPNGGVAVTDDLKYTSMFFCLLIQSVVH